MPDQMSIMDTTIEERLPHMYRAAGPVHFPIMELAGRTVDGVTKSDGANAQLGKLYQVKHGWKIGSAGMIRSVNPLGPPALDIGTEGRVMDNLGSDTDMAPWPSAGGSPLPGDFVRTLQLSACTGNFPIPMHWAFSDSLDRQTLKQVVRIISTAAIKTKRQDAQSYYAYRATSSGGGKVTVLGRALSFTKTTYSTRAGGTNANFVDIVIDPKYGRIANFSEGDELDIVANSGGSATEAGTLQSGTATDGTDIRNYAAVGAPYVVQLTVTKVDRRTNTITVIGIARKSEYSTPGADIVQAYDQNTHGWTVDQNGVPAAYDWICPRGVALYDAASTRPWLTHGVFDWLADSGTIMGGAADAQGLDVDEYPMFKSILHTASAPLTENLLNRISIASATQFPDVTINNWQTTPGALLKFKEEIQDNTTSRFDRTNLPFKVKGGWAVSDYTTPEGTYQWWTSPYMHEGKMIGQQIDKQNLKLYTNKIIGDTQSGFAEDVQFVGKMMGYPGAKVPETAANGTLKVVSGMPWIRFVLLCPIMPNGWLIDDLTEANVLDFSS